MRFSKGRCFLASVLVGMGCTSAKPVTPSAGTPTPIPVITPTAAATSWVFRYSPTVSSYRISRSAAIEAPTDSGMRREVSTNTTHETISLEILGDTTKILATVDTFSTISKGATGLEPPVQLPVQLAAVLDRDSLAITWNVTSGLCNVLESTVATDLRNLLPHFPDSLSIGLTWKDSAAVDGCQAGIPMKSRYMRSFRVMGEAKQDNLPVLVVQRIDSVQAHGEGTQQQHRITLDAVGAGGATYYLDFNNGRIVRIDLSQDSNLTITASGKTTRFRQNAREDYILGR